MPMRFLKNGCPDHCRFERVHRLVQGSVENRHDYHQTASADSPCDNRWYDFPGIRLYGYHLATRLTDGGETAVLLGEKLLFAGIVASLAMAFLVFMMLRLSTNLERRLDRLIDQGKTRDIVPGRDFVGMGPLGDKLTALFNLLSKLNEQKTRKISAMQALAVFLVRKMDVLAIVTDIKGMVLYVSDDLLDERELKRQDVINTSVTDRLSMVWTYHIWRSS